IIIQRIDDNPDNLFSFSIDRLRRQRDLWHPAIKPILGALLVARESLSPRALRHLAGSADADMVRRALDRLGGLVVQDSQAHYYLYHLKFGEFLREDPEQPQRAYVFARDEVEAWHQRLANWCEGPSADLSVIWQPSLDTAESERRTYAQQHYI